MRSMRMHLSGWGRYPAAECSVFRPERYSDLRPVEETCIARGCGRSYGDASLCAEGSVLLTERVNRLLELDPEQGTLRAEAGATLDEILTALVPRGWFLPVVPGTRYVSLGGCVASDIHGKNQHHDGTFGDHVLGLEVIVADGTAIHCSPTVETDLFRATVGGMGLTGIIGEVTVRLIPIESAFVTARFRATSNLSETFEVLDDPQWDDQYTVAWLDCLAPDGKFGRGIISRGHHSKESELPRDTDPLTLKRKPRRAVPMDAPGWTLNRYAMRLYNEHYYRRHARIDGDEILPLSEHFFPLDGIDNWNRLYGKRGFLQYQFVLPEQNASEGCMEILGRLSRAGHPPLLAVLKRFGRPGPGLLSFAIPGHTLALDFPVGDGSILQILEEIDETVVAAGGRIYLAKDARMSPSTFKATYPGYQNWLAIKRRYDPQSRIRSELAARLEIGLDP